MVHRIFYILPLVFAGPLRAADLPVIETPVGRLALPVLPDSLSISPDSSRIAFATNAGNVTLEDKGIFLKPPTGAAQESNLPKNLRASIRLYIDDKSTPAYEVLTPLRFSHAQITYHPGEVEDTLRRVAARLRSTSLRSPRRA